MSKKNVEFAAMADLQEEQKKLKKKMAKLKIPCSHTKSNGKLKVEFIKGTLARCKNCGCIFDFGAISKDELENAIETVHNAINQIKSFSNDPAKEESLIRELGSIDYNLEQVAELYARTIDRYGKGNNKKKKNRNNRGDSFGSYGAGNLGFIDTRRKF